MIYLLQTGKLVQSFRESWNAFIDQLPGYLTAILIVAIGVFISNKLTYIFKRIVANKTEDPLMTNFLARAIKVILIILVLMFAMRIAGLQGIANTLLTAAGASAVIIGFAFRDIGENFISGIILSFNRPFNINDTIQSGDIFGKVKSMEFRYTKVKTFDGKDVYIPNSDVLKKPLFNYTEDGFIRWEFVAGIAYEDNVEAAEALIMKTVNDNPKVINEEEHETFIIVDELAVSTVNLKIYFWVDTKEFRKEAIKIRGDVISDVKTALDEAGFSLPADIQEIKLYGSQQSIPVSIKTVEEIRK